jgi:ketosteroid isomerase-like protein
MSIYPMLTVESRHILLLLACLLGGSTLACSMATGSDAKAPAPTPYSGVDETADGVTWNPYHAVVRSKILNAFRGLSNHDPAPALDVMADDVNYTFDGEHALGGTRVTRTGVKRWFGRLFRLLPGPFVIRSVDVAGWPWRTRVVTTFEHYAAPEDGGPPYWGAATQVLDLRWGAAVQIHTRVTDMDRLVRTLDALAANGNAEAKAPPIVE